VFVYAVYDFSSEYRNYFERPQKWNDYGSLNKFDILVCNYGNSWFIVELSCDRYHVLQIIFLVSNYVHRGCYVFLFICLSDCLSALMYVSVDKELINLPPSASESGPNHFKEYFNMVR